MAKRNSSNGRVDKLVKLAELNEKRWRDNEKRWKNLAGYIRSNEAEKKKLFQEIVHLRQEFRRWMQEQ